MSLPPSSDPSAPPLSIIVVSYNTREMTLECLRSLVAQTRIPYQLIVIDNASGDGSAAAIAAEFPDILLLAETDNHGFAKGNNIAARHATGDYLLLLNPDTIVLDGAIDRLMEFARARPEAQIWGGRTFFADMSLNPASCWQRMTLWNTFCQSAGLAKVFANSALFNAEAYGGWDRSTERQVDIVSGCFFLLKRALWDALGGFNLTYVMYGEEADLCHRAAREHGALPRVTPEAKIVHYAGASEKVHADKMIRLLNAKTTLIKHHFPAWQKPLALAAFRAGPLARAKLIGLLSRFSKSPRVRTAAETWTSVWDRRRDWWDGYQDI